MCGLIVARFVGRDVERSSSHAGILIFKCMCAERAARNCQSAGINLERSIEARMEKSLVKMEKVRMEKIPAKMKQIVVTIR